MLIKDYLSIKSKYVAFADSDALLIKSLDFYRHYERMVPAGVLCSPKMP
jgi:hypothetical protein